MGVRLSIEDVKLYVKENSDAKCVDSNYVNNSTKMKFQCSCGEEFKVAFNKFKSGQTKCKTCSTKISGSKRAKTNSQFVKEVQMKYGQEYLINDLYQGALEPLSVTHVLCGHSWKAIPTYFLGGRSCPECSKMRVIMNNRKTHDGFVEEVFNLVENEYSVVGRYVNSLTKVALKHNECGYKWDTRPSHFTHNNRRCPQCSFSKGEELIADFLMKKNIKFESQKKFEDCRSHINKSYLRFDFAIYDSSGTNIKFLVEFDGRQHFEPVDFWGGEERFLIQKQYDEIKNQYCKERNLILLRIPYWDQHRIKEVISELLEGGVEVA